MVSENESEFMERGCSVVCGGGVLLRWKIKIKRIVKVTLEIFE